MERKEVLRKLRKQAKPSGLDFAEYELKNHTGIKIGNTKATLGRHNEIDDVTVRKFFDQFADEFGKGWWR